MNLEHTPHPTAASLSLAERQRVASGVRRVSADKALMRLVQSAPLLTRSLHPALITLVMFLVSLLGPLPAAQTQSVRFSGTTAVKSSATPVTVTVALTSAGTLDTIKVRTQGSDGFDFSNTGKGTCQAGQGYSAGQSCTVTVGFAPTAPGSRVGAVILLDKNNVVLGLSRLQATATGGVTAFIPGRMDTVAGDEVWVYAGDGGAATSSSIFLPFGVVVDAAGDLIIADSSNARIRRVDGVTNTISTLAGTGTIGGSGDGGPATSANLSNPTTVLMDAAGNVFFSDTGNNVVRRISAFDGTISTVAGTMGSHGYAGDGAAANKALLDGPNGLSLDADGNLYIADTSNNVIRKLSAATGMISTVAGTGVAGFAGDGSPATGAQFNGPWGVTSAGNTLYIADQNNHVIRFINSAGIISTIVGQAGQAGFSGDGGLASAAQLNVPASVVPDVAGNLYIADSGNNRVRKVSALTGFISTVAGNQNESISGDGGPANVASLYGPYALALDGQGSLFIADVFHNRIRKLSSNGAVLMYPAMRVGRVTTPLSQTLENDGNATMTIASVLAVSQAQIDAPTTTCAAALGPLGQCVIGASFAPTQIALLDMGTAQVNSDAGNSPGTLTLEGQVLSTDPSTIVLSSTPNPSTTGSAVTFAITASSAGTTPTGTVTLLDGTNSIASGQLQAGGVLTLSVTSLTAGSHTITASYAGDNSNAAGVSPPVVQVVHDAQAATTTMLSSSTNPAIAGAPLTLTAAVAELTPGSGSGAITGTVAFMDGVNQLGTANVTSGSATLTVSTLTVGTHNLTASYKGATNYNVSSSNVVAELVQIASTKAALSTSSNPSPAGAALTLTASVLSSGGTATGSVTFTDGGLSLGSANLNAQGVATLIVPGTHWTVGTHSLGASYAGDAADTGCTSVATPQTVVLATTLASIGSTLNPSALGASVTFGVSVHSNGGTPSGSVQILDGSSVIGAVTLDSTGAGYFTTAALAVGSHTMTASYQGDSNDSAITSYFLTQVVQTATTSIAFSTGANPSIFGSGLVLTSTVSGSGAIPTGSVTFMDGGSVLTSVNLDSTGAASLSTSTLSIGSHSLTAVYSGDKVHTAVTSTAVAERILQATSTALALSTLHSVAGTTVTGSVQVTGNNSKPLTGSVALSDGATVLATLTPDANGAASFTLPNLAPGSHTLLAAYAGDTNDAASNSASVVELVDTAATTIAFNTSANPIASGAALTLTVTLSGNGGTPTGTISFLDGTTVLSTVPLTNGVARLTTSTLAPGVHQLSASYAGDTDDHASVSNVIAEQVALQTSLAVTSSANPSLLTDNVTVTLTLANGSSSVPTGSVLLMDGTATLATLAVDPTGHAVYTFAAPALGTHTLTASYAGDPQNGPATSPPLVQTVLLRPTTNSFTASATSIAAGQQVVLMSVVQGAGPRVATGTVTFAAGGTVLGTATVTATGLAELTVKPLQGNYNVVSTYTGDALYAASTSQALDLTVGPPVEFNLNLTPASMTLQTGQHGSFQVALTSAATFKDTLALGCSGLPFAATCTFSQDQLAVSGGVPQTVTVTVDTGNPLGVGGTARLESSRSGGPLLCMLPAGALLALLLGRKRYRRPLGLLCVVLLLATAGTLTGCGNSFTQSSTPTGAYTFQIVGTGNTTGATQSAAFSLKVTQ